MLSENVATYLENNGIGTKGTDIFIGAMPDTQDDAVLIEDTGGVEPDRYVEVKKNTIQSTIRDVSYKTGYEKTDSIYHLLHRKYDPTVLEIGGVDVMLIEALSEPTYIGKDENGRFMFTINSVIWFRDA
jgi:hypothetical protein